MAEIQPLQQQETQINGAGAAPPAENVTTAKRNRRPSVRLGEIGDQPAATATLFHESHRRPKQSKVGGKDPASKSSKTRPLAKLSVGSYHQETLDLEEEDRDSNFDDLAIGNWRTRDSKSKRAAKKPRTNWLPKIEEGGVRSGEEDVKFGMGDDGGGGGVGIGDGDEYDEDDGFDRDFEREGLGSPSKEQSPANSLGGLGIDDQLRRHQSSSRVRVEDERDHDHGDDGIELDGPFDTHRNVGHSGRAWSSEDGVKNWLNGLGLGRYWPVFEIHEVDEEVLPLLTLEDLKDMGISAVGSRRKMFLAIQKLRKGFS